MATSSIYAIERVMAAIIALRPGSVLDVGCGPGRYGFLCREKLEEQAWLRRMRVGDGPSDLRLDTIEVFPDNITPLHRLIYDNIQIGDIRELVAHLDTYDVVLMGDVIEHLEKDHGYRVLNSLLQKTRQAIIIVTPAFHYEQGALFGNEAERHCSFWETKDFKRYPFYVVDVVGLEAGKPAYVAVICKDEDTRVVVKHALLPNWKQKMKRLASGLLGARRTNGLLRLLNLKGTY